MTVNEDNLPSSSSSRGQSADEANAEEVLSNLQKRRATHQRRFHARGPKKVQGVVARLMEKRGYAQIRTVGLRDEAWHQAAGEEVGRISQVVGIRRGVFEVLVANSLVVQELTFSKETLLAKLQHALPDAGIKQLRFRVGQLNQ